MKVNDLISKCISNGLDVISNDMININVILKDGLHLTKDGTVVLPNNVFKYLTSYEGNKIVDGAGQFLWRLPKKQEQTIRNYSGY